MTKKIGDKILKWEIYIYKVIIYVYIYKERSERVYIPKYKIFL